MTVRVDFYVLEGQGHHLREQYACRVIEKAYKLGHKIYVHTSGETQASAIDDMLWTFHQDSFVPHARVEGADSSSTQVLIGHTGDRNTKSEILINLSPDVPPFFKEYQRVVEIIDQSDDVKVKGRERFMYYREQNCDVNSHNVSG